MFIHNLIIFQQIFPDPEVVALDLFLRLFNRLGQRTMLYLLIFRNAQRIEHRYHPLVGTITIEASEELSSLLKKRGIEHKVLNAKFHELEAEIVADAGIHGAVTIATNMAGRGTDIKLDEEARAAGGLKIIG